jgi:peptide/nickel transport system permease protein
MLKFIGKRALWLLPVLLGAIFIVFAINEIDPGDPVAALLGSGYTQEEYDDKEAELGLDRPFMVRYVDYVAGVVHGDFGVSYTTKRPISDELKERFGVTFKLAVISILIAALLGLPSGVLSAVRQYSAADNAVTVASLLFASMPGFWLALMLMLAFALNLKLFPASGIEGWKSWVLPSLASGLSFVATITRMTRSSMLDVVRQDYIRTARAKGLDEKTVIMKHGVKNAMIPIITTIGFQFGMLVSGSVIVETIFSLPGLGTLMMTAINNRDYPVIMGCVIILAVLICLINLVVDIMYGLVDPRIMEQIRGTGGGRRRPAKAKEAGA